MFLLKKLKFGLLRFLVFFTTPFYSPGCMLTIINIYFNFTIIINNSLNGVQAYCAAIKQIDLKYILGQNNYGDNVFSCEFLTSWPKNASRATNAYSAATWRIGLKYLA